MAQQHFVIIGNGAAANSAAHTLREKAPDARLTMIGKECSAQYQPRKLPDFIAGRISEEDLYVHPVEHYKQAGIKLRLGQEVVDVDFTERSVILHHKEKIHFDGLIVATGGKPRIPEPLIVFEDLFLTLKTVNDAKNWMDRLQDVESVLIVGGDLTSLCLTKALLDLNKEVHFVMDEGSFWPVRFSEDVQREVAERLTSRGVHVHSGKKVKRVACVDRNRCHVETDKESMDVGIVGAFFGLMPDIKFLTKSGLHIERGILVDEYLCAGPAGVYAAGDCAQVYNNALRDYWVSIGWTNAEQLGRVAALNLAGDRVRAEASPESIFDVEGITVNTSWWTEF